MSVFDPVAQRLVDNVFPATPTIDMGSSINPADLECQLEREWARNQGLGNESGMTDGWTIPALIGGIGLGFFLTRYLGKRQST